MRILVIHNFYQQPGGEDQVYRDEVALLKSHGHEVFQYEVHNDAITKLSKWKLLKKTIGNREIARELHELVKRENIEIAHFHNTFPLISPTAYRAVGSAGAKVIQTLHNFRLLCPNGLFLRDNQPCEQCLNRLVSLPAIKNKCYRNSRSATTVVSGMLAYHRLRGTWQKSVDRYIALTQFAKNKFIAGGLPEEKICAKGNFVSNESIGDKYQNDIPENKYAIYVGRLSEEKGIRLLLAAWEKLGNVLPLKIVGSGDLQAEVDQAVARNPAITALGHLNSDELMQQLRRATMMILPSQCYEGFPKTIAEAFACGTPVVASAHGAMAELVDHQQTGALFTPGSVDDLVNNVQQLANSPELLKQLSDAARSKFEKQYTAKENYRQLINIYCAALGIASSESTIGQKPHDHPTSSSPV